MRLRYVHWDDEHGDQVLMVSAEDLALWCDQVDLWEFADTFRALRARTPRPFGVVDNELVP